jgi:hypothetical protein
MGNKSTFFKLELYILSTYVIVFIKELYYN